MMHITAAPEKAITAYIGIVFPNISTNGNIKLLSGGYTNSVRHADAHITHAIKLSAFMLVLRMAMPAANPDAGHNILNIMRASPS